MRGLMMDVPLTIRAILERGAVLFPEKEVATRTASGLHRYSYGDLHARACRLANALRALGVRPGDRVGTFAWNTAPRCPRACSSASTRSASAWCRRGA
jgi:fatty-acyl-CoA synthase